VFDFFTSPEKKARASAVQWLETARRVWNFRRDRMTPEQAAEVARRRAELGDLLRERAGAERLEGAAASLDAALRQAGGRLHPRDAWTENVEFLLFAAILILGCRTYFVQPMVIPTNSMWPTYNGMTAENFPPGTPAPGIVERAARLIAFGAVRKEADAPVSGEVSALFALDLRGQPHLVPEIVDGKSWLVFPAKYSEYTFFVGDAPVRLRVPADFHELEPLFLAAYFHDRNEFAAQWERAREEGRLLEVVPQGVAAPAFRVFRLPLGRTVNAGDPVIRFDLLKGDMLLVDRLSYHFVRPSVGSAFVFETEAIPDFPSGVDGSDEFLIKRLVGLPGDTLEIREPVLYRNGSPIRGAGAFALNARREGGYRGYFNAPDDGGRYLFAGKSATVPPHSFMGLGDNSAVSEDGRYWGFVPEKDVQGRPIFIYYPFSRHWGFAK
jgi:signal peptidase I